MKNLIIIFGKPGAGKGTKLEQAINGKEDQFEVISVGNLLRKAVSDKSPFGREVEAYMNKGLLVPDNLINAIVLDGILSSTKTVLTDGFPRTVGQAKVMLEYGIVPSKVIHVELDDEIIVERAKSRIVCERCSAPYTTTSFKPPKVEGICDKCGGHLIRRKDDAENVVRERLKVYENETQPVLEVLQAANVPVFTVDNAQPDSKLFKKLLLEYE